ncbi:MAG TPA: glycosyltransferase [Candidatus Competibacteraceae bacterium]|nr:glycosyltransferase [Candidatus Competibacteraceae bacterium]
MPISQPRIIVFSTLFPSPAQPAAGLFIRERMFRVARRLPLIIVSPQPWFPFQRLIRRFRPHFRPPAPAFERQQGIAVYRPRFLSLPGVLRGLDGWSMALCSLPLLRRLRRDFDFQLIDAHFAYPDGYAATWLGRWLKVPVTITLRGTEVPLSRTRWRRRLLLQAVARANGVISVADSLRQHLGNLGAEVQRIQVIGNGVDSTRFAPVSRAEARKALGIADEAPVLISVGGLVERKGFHRVIDCLPTLLKQHPGLRYLIVGGGGPEGDWRGRLEAQVQALGLTSMVTFLGPLPPDELKFPLSAADIFVLATSNEGWANVFLEAMACGLPVITTDVGGNREVVCDHGLGIIVPFGDGVALEQALLDALSRTWDRMAIRRHAEANDWEGRVGVLCELFRSLITSPTLSLKVD